jgi:hypothetical protein
MARSTGAAAGSLVALLLQLQQLQVACLSLAAITFSPCTTRDPMTSQEEEGMALAY